MGSLKQKIIDTPQSEDSGANTAKRYAYQACFGLALVFERHALEGDYAVVFEFHDDVALFNDSSEPTAVRFYQVKTKDNGIFTSAQIAKKTTKKGINGLSIVGKMYRNVEQFGEAVEASVLVSNAGAAFAKGASQICFKDCSDDDLQRILKRLEQEFPNSDTLKIDLLRFEKCDLSLDDMDTHAKGKLNAFVNAQLGEVEFSVSALYRTVHQEIYRKSKSPTCFSSFEQTVSDRGVTRADADRWLETVKGVTDYPKWEEISPDIVLPAQEKAKVRAAYNSYRIEVLNPNEAHRQVQRLIRSELNSGKFTSLDLANLAGEIALNVEVAAQKIMPSMDLAQLKAMVIYETFTE